jgi:hypothetical protein
VLQHPVLHFLLLLLLLLLLGLTQISQRTRPLLAHPYHSVA